MLGFYSGPRQTITSLREYIFAPRWLLREWDSPFIRREDIEVFDSFWQFCCQRRPRKIMFYRTYALGDILMLVPIARVLRRALGLDQPVVVAVGFPFHHSLRAVPASSGVRFVQDMGVADYGCDVHVDLNSTLEIDHRGGEASNHHRVMLYAMALGLNLEAHQCHKR